MIRITLKLRQAARQFIVFSTLTGLPAFAQQPFVPAPHRPVPRPSSSKHTVPAAPRSMVGGYWRTDANYKSALYLKNALANAPLTVTPVLYLSTGANYTLPDVTLEPSGIALVDINAALQQQGIAPWATLGGYVEVKYAWGWDALCVTVHNVDPAHSEIFNFNLRPAAPSIGQNPAVPAEGLWWKQEPNVAGFLALTNLSSNSQNASVVVSDQENTPIGQHTVTVAPHGTKLVDMAEVRSSSSIAGGIRITLDGLQADWVVSGWLEDPAVGYSANIPVSFPLPSTIKQLPPPDVAELGLMTGAASPMLAFPSGTVFTPYSVVRNPSDQAVSVTPTLWWMEGAAPRSATLPAVTVPPKQAQNLDVPSLLSNAGLGNFSGSVNLVLNAAGPPSTLLLAAGSVDQKNTYVFQVTPFAVSEDAGRSASYWSTGNGDDTMVTLWNPADEAQDFLFTLMYAGGHYAYPVHLDPRATRMFNISELIRSQVPDAEGNVVPLSVHEGSATLTGAKSKAERILVSIEVGTYNVQKATCAGPCVTCNGAVGGWIDGASVYVGGSTPLTLTMEWYDGYNYTDLNDTVSASWTSSDTNIATFSGNSMTGVNVGTVTVTAYDPNYPVYDSCAISACSYGWGATGDFSVVGDPTPVVSSISPNPWQAGVSTPITIIGSGFGTSPTVSTNDSYVSLTITAVGDTSIAGNVFINPNDPGGNITVYVTSNGYGMGFQPATPGQSNQASNTVGVNPTAYNVTVSNGGSTVTSGSTQYITADPLMPQVSAQTQGGPGAYSTQWSLTVSYTRPDGTGTNTDTFGPATTTGANPWTVPWNGNFRGGSATLNWIINGTRNGSISFNIGGINPSYTAIDTEIGSRNPPWFFTRMVSHESTYRQFDASGNSLFTNDKGYGLTQATTSNGQDLWNWKGNITAGLSILNGKQAGAYSFWQSQITQWQNYNAGVYNNGVPPPKKSQLGPPPDNNAGGPCLFAYPVRSGTYGYDDGNWIKAYNGAAKYFAYIIISSGTSAYWVTNNDPAPYVHLVCQAPVL